tara:strand:- start:237 stop:1040 length:804 start_codon:yes stop_codon:yes gene_type:complete
MPSVSNISVGGQIAAAAATKARHGMNESIARLSTGVRAMYGGDAAGLSFGTSLNSIGQSQAQAARNVEDGISYLQSSESVLLEVANLLTRMRELGVQNDNNALTSASDEAAIDSEVALITATIDAVLDNTQFNGVELVDIGVAGKTVNVAYTGETSTINTTIGVGTSMATLAGNNTGDTARTAADTHMGLVASALGNVAADLSALKGFQATAHATSANLIAAGARILDTDFAQSTADLTKNSILNQAAMAMAAQANQAQSAILTVLQ